MDWKRVTCAETISRLALKKNDCGVHRYIINMDPNLPMESLIRLPFSAFRSFVVMGHNDHKEITQVVDYIWTKAAPSGAPVFRDLGCCSKG